MKRNLSLFVPMMLGAIVLYLGTTSSLFGRSDDQPLNVWSSPGLNELTAGLVKAYAETNPGIELNLLAIGEIANSNEPQKTENVGLVSEAQLPRFSRQSSWKLVVGREIFIPVMNSGNPFLKDIQTMGISPDEFQKLFTSQELTTWGYLVNGKDKTPVNCLTEDDEATNICLAAFLGADPIMRTGDQPENMDKLHNLIARDPYAIGFGRLADLLDPVTGLNRNLAIVPIDLNGDNKIEHFENIYSSVGELERGIWIGKYPKSLYSSIYAVAGFEPESAVARDFLSWILTEGQVLLSANGYSELVNSERNSKLLALYADQQSIQAVHDKPMQTISTLYIIGLIIAGIFLVLIIAKIFQPKNYKTVSFLHQDSPAFSEQSLIIPEGLFFDKSHTWAFMEKEGFVRTGVDDFLQHVTGTLTRIKMKNPGEKISRGETFLTMIQVGKQLEIKSPVSGTIFETNLQLSENAQLLNSAPFDEGWVYRIKTVNWMKEIKTLFMADNYREWIRNEFIRLKDFLSLKVMPKAPGQVQVVMQEGGEFKDGVLEHFGPEVWEEFQTEFIQTSK